MASIPLRVVLAADLEAMAAGSSWMGGVARVLVFPRFRAVLCYRVGCALAARGLRPVAHLLAGRMLSRSGAEISPLAEVGPGLCVMHTSGIVVGHQVRVGARLKIYQGVTLGDGPRSGQPLIGDDVTIGAGAMVLGGVVVGDGARIGAGAVVVDDVPTGSTFVGARAVEVSGGGGAW
jgi:serine O-acetyltransferase